MAIQFVVSGIVNKLFSKNGTTPSAIRQAVEGDLVVTENQGKFFQKVSEGDAYVLNIPISGTALGATSTTAALGTLATATPIFSIANGGTQNISINKEYLATITGTPVVGSFVWYTVNGITLSALSALTDSSQNKLGGANGLPANVKCGVFKALTGIGTPTPNLYDYFGSMNTVTASVGVIDKEVNGDIVVPPNTLLFCLAPTGATHTVHGSVNFTAINVA